MNSISNAIIIMLCPNQFSHGLLDLVVRGLVVYKSQTSSKIFAVVYVKLFVFWNQGSFSQFWSLESILFWFSLFLRCVSQLLARHCFINFECEYKHFEKERISIYWWRSKVNCQPGRAKSIAIKVYAMFHSLALLEIQKLKIDFLIFQKRVIPYP